MDNLSADATPRTISTTHVIPASNSVAPSVEPVVARAEPAPDTVTELPKLDLIADAAAVARIPGAPARSNSYVVLAGAVIIAAGLGTLAGGLAATGLARAPEPALAAAATND